MVINKSLLAEISENILPYLTHQEYNPEDTRIMLSFSKKKANEGWVEISILKKEQVSLNKMIGYCIVDKYFFFIVGEDCAYSFIEKNRGKDCNFTFYNYPPLQDGVISWLYRWKEDKVHLITFNEQW